MVLYTYCEYLQALSTTPERQATIEAIQRGKVTVKNSQFISLMLSLRMVSRVVIAISDLALLILRNHTTASFVMGDAPCVFSNHYMRTIRNSGVLGLMTPGLMITLPIDPRTQILLYDTSVYKPDYSTAGCIDVFRLADVSLLNALQIHSTEKNIYFSDINAETYVHDLLDAHRSLLQNQQGRLVIHRPGTVLIDGAPSTDEVLYTFEPQLPITLDLSFISTSSLPPNTNPNRPRDQVLARQTHQALGWPDEASPIGMDEFARWVESQICI